MRNYEIFTKIKKNNIINHFKVIIALLQFIQTKMLALDFIRKSELEKCSTYRRGIFALYLKLFIVEVIVMTNRLSWFSICRYSI